MDLNVKKFYEHYFSGIIKNLRSEAIENYSHGKDVAIIRGDIWCGQGSVYQSPILCMFRCKK